MQKKEKKVLVRLPQELYERLEAWATHNMRSINSEITVIVRDELHTRRSETIPITNPHKPVLRSAAPKEPADSTPVSPVHLLPKNMGLTTRQKQVLMLLGTGASYSKIGSELGVERDTVRAHARAIFQKFGVKTRKEWDQVRLTEYTDPDE